MPVAAERLLWPCADRFDGRFINDCAPMKSCTCCGDTFLYDDAMAATQEARFARALDRAQPMLQNLYTEGASWRAHDISATEVRRRNGPLVRDGAPELWAVIDPMLDDAVARGWLRP